MNIGDKVPENQNNELSYAWDFVEHTGRSIFLTGKAGTGKTTFLKTVVERSSKRSIVVAPTGVAAITGLSSFMWAATCAMLLMGVSYPLPTWETV